MDLLSKALLDYCENYSSPEPEILQKLNRHTHVNMLQPRMLSGHMQGRFLSMISKLARPKHILEIGAYTGYSALCLAEGLQPDGKLITVEVNPEFEDTIRDFIDQSEMKHSIQLIIGDGYQIVRTLPQQFDLIFLDADKVNYPGYYDLLIERLTRGGLLIADNVLWSGKVADPNEVLNDRDTRVLHTFNEKARNDERVECLLLPVRDGISMIRKR